MKKETRIPISDEAFLEKSLDFIESNLKEMGLKQRKIMNAMLIAEESIVKCFRVAKPGSKLRISIRKVLADITVRISLPGTQNLEFSVDEIFADGMADPDDPETAFAIQDIILRSFQDKMKYQYRNGINIITIMASEAERTFVYATIASLILGVIVGLLMRVSMPAAIAGMLSENVFQPITTIFMNALHLVVGPGLFFSVVICVSQFSGAREFGRVFQRVFRNSVLTTIIAIVVSLLLFQLIRPGIANLSISQQMITQLGHSVYNAIDVQQVEIPTILSLVQAVVPNNIVSPFLETNTLQILFLAVVIGIAAGAIGRHSAVVQPLMEAFDSLVTVITIGISRLMPVVAFVSIVTLLISDYGTVLLGVLSMTAVQILAFVVMIGVYALMVLLGGKLNPAIFIKKALQGMGVSFSLCSSNAAVPNNIRTCTKRFGVSPKIANLSIPFGATFNMDGSAIGFIITTLFMVHLYGVDMTPRNMVFLVLMTLLLSFQTPGVPGAGIIAQSALLVYFGVPIEAMGIILGTNAILDMFATMSNTTGDLAVTCVVAAQEKELNRNLYNNKSR